MPANPSSPRRRAHAGAAAAAGTGAAACAGAEAGAAAATSPPQPQPLPQPQPQPLEIVLRGEYITLDALLKCTGLASSGGAAKVMIASGQVEVDGQVEARRGRKLRAGQQVTTGGVQVRVLAPAMQP